MSNIRLIMLDIDGTLTNEKKEITKKTKEALIKAQEKGARLVLASGRPTSGLQGYAKELEMDKHHGIFVSFNGAKVTDCMTGEVLFNDTMTVEQGQAVLQHMKKFDVKPMIDKGEYMYVNDVYNCDITYKGEPFNIIKYEARNNRFKLCEKSDLAAFADYPLNKILTAGTPEYLEKHYIEMMEPFKDNLNCMFTAAFYFEFTSKGIDKAKALDTALIPMGYKREEMIAFGDGHNDISMIKYAGIGVAMDNAVDDLKKAADEVTLSNEEDGIAYTLNKYMDL